ncbi:hypothetical protein Y032_0513g2761 [Ancylostoma ceylanicum]|uniref:Uncharacterized protein n=1 Tax=Ancylostoma ceylanicum TaxID=53326 RepID=A0A016WSU9_9BILA|nr:hypothetical protein Y032_0513g2761 [Ancylostoma ceylanicum]
MGWSMRTVGMDRGWLAHLGEYRYNVLSVQIAHVSAGPRRRKKQSKEKVKIVGVDGGGSSTASKSKRCDRAAHDGIVAAVANMDFISSCSSRLMMLTTKETN